MLLPYRPPPHGHHRLQPSSQERKEQKETNLGHHDKYSPPLHNPNPKYLQKKKKNRKQPTHFVQASDPGGQTEIITSTMQFSPVQVTFDTNSSRSKKKQKQKEEKRRMEKE